MRYFIHFVHHTRIGNESTTTGKHRSQLCRNKTSQVTGMGTHSMKSIKPHSLINFVYTSGNWLYQPSTADNGVKLERNSFLLQLRKYKRFTKIKLIGHLWKGSQLVYRMTNITNQQRSFILKNGNLRRSRTRINGEYLHYTSYLQVRHAIAML